MGQGMTFYEFAQAHPFWTAIYLLIVTLPFYALADSWRKGPK